MGFSYANMKNLQQALDLYLPTQAGKVVRVDSPDILEICCYNFEIAETELRIGSAGMMIIAPCWTRIR